MATPTNPTPTLTAPTGINKREVIQASELRIGNHINTPDGIGVVDGLATYYKKPIISVSGNSYIQNSVFGIPLTEELLLKMGAKPQSDTPNYHLRIGATFIVLRIQGGKCYAEFGNVYLGEIEFLHRLQNLVYALCGQELTLS